MKKQKIKGYSQKSKLQAGIIGYCSFKWHRMDITKDILEIKQCHNKRCKHFTWLSKREFKKWLNEKLYGVDK